MPVFSNFIYYENNTKNRIFLSLSYICIPFGDNFVARHNSVIPPASSIFRFGKPKSNQLYTYTQRPRTNRSGFDSDLILTPSFLPSISTTTDLPQTTRQLNLLLLKISIRVDILVLIFFLFTYSSRVISSVCCVFFLNFSLLPHCIRLEGWEFHVSMIVCINFRQQHAIDYYQFEFLSFTERHN